MTGTKKYLLSAAALLAAGGAPATQSPSRSGWSKKPFGVILLVPEGGRDFSASLTGMVDKLSIKFPMTTALTADLRGIQKAVDLLESRRVEKIVAVPLLLSSHSEEMDQNRYFFGIRRDPSPSLLSGRSHYGYAPLKRVKTKVPLVLMPAFDDHEITAQILAAKALGQSRDAEKETLIFVADVSENDLKNTQWSGGIKALGERARSIGGFRESRTFFLPDDTGQTERDKTRRELRDLVRDTRRDGRVIIVPLSLTKGALHAKLSKILGGTFAVIMNKGLLPDPRILPWIEESVQKGAKIANMRTFTKEAALRPKTETLKKEPARMSAESP